MRGDDPFGLLAALTCFAAAAADAAAAAQHQLSHERYVSLSMQRTQCTLKQLHLSKNMGI